MNMFLTDITKDRFSGIDKTAPPEDTIKRAYRLFASLDRPVVQKVERIDKHRLGIPVYISRYTPEAARLTHTRKQMGKGATPAQAEASAIMELAERYSLFSFHETGEYLVKANLSDDTATIPCEELLQSLNWHAAAPAAADTDRELSNIRSLLEVFPMRWVKAFRPDRNCFFHVPWSWFWQINEYNGSAAGNCREEAAIQAICEVVERHVCAIISRERLTTPLIDAASVKDPTARELLDKFTARGIQVVLKDFSLNTGIPTIGAIAWDPSTYPKTSEIVYTAGTAPHPERALIRCLTEVAQLAGDFDTDGRYVESGLPKFATHEEADYVLEFNRICCMDELPDISSDNFRIEIENACASLQRIGIPVYLVDISHAGLGIPAVYAILPGNHFRERAFQIDPAFHMARLTAPMPPEQAVELLLHLQRLYPDRYFIHFYLGYARERLDRPELAIEHYRDALASNPDPNELASIHCHIGNALKEMQRFDEAISALNEARALNADLKEVHNLLGYCHYKKGEHAAAVEAFERAIELDPTSATDYANIGVNLAAMGMKAPAARWLEMALELEPELQWAREKLKALQQG
ncbi:MAG: YcaO-like family protein [Deltaproteobacteria bacterium]|nr:YcaO-like family protein [Deltaproteobacteria bacterium]